MRKKWNQWHFIFLGSKITVDGDCSHDIKRHLPLGRKAMINLDSILKCRDITLPTKVKAMVFPVVVYGCECWTVKKAERRRADAFKLWGWRRFLRVPWTTRSNQSILKINPECSVEGLMLKVKLQYFGHLIRRGYSLEKTLMLGKTEGRRRGVMEDEMVGWHHWFNGHGEDGEGQGSMACCSPWGHRVEHDLAIEQHMALESL